MPKALESKLKKQAHKLVRKGKLSPKKVGAYVYGTMRKQGWNPGVKTI